MKDLTDLYAAELDKDAEEMVAELAELGVRQTAMVDHFAKVANEAIEVMAKEARAIRERHKERTDEIHRRHFSAMATRAREFMSGPEKPSLAPPGQPNPPPTEPSSEAEEHTNLPPAIAAPGESQRAAAA